MILGDNSIPPGREGRYRLPMQRQFTGKYKKEIFLHPEKHADIMERAGNRKVEKLDNRLFN